MNVVEYKGSTTAEKLAQPQVNPATLSKGYVYKGPGEADKTAPQQLEIDSYAFAPVFVIVPQGDTVAVRVFVVNGDKHEVSVVAPDGQVAVPTATWTRGGEYPVSLKAEKVGTYKLSCAIHGPSMTANILVLPRWGDSAGVGMVQGSVRQARQHIRWNNVTRLSHGQAR